MKSRIFVAVAFAVMIGGCKGTAPAKLEPGQSVTLQGEIVSGAECPMLRLAGDRRVALTGDLGRFGPGDHVCVRGTVAEMSFCMAGEATIAITSIAPADSCK